MAHELPDLPANAAMIEAEPKVRYEGNPAHKRYPSKWGAAGLRSDKSECPTALSPSEVARVMPVALQKAIAAKQCYHADGDRWPRVVWGRSAFQDNGGLEVELVWEARVTNPAVPSYHAYPVTPERHDSKLSRRIAVLLWPDD